MEPQYGICKVGVAPLRTEPSDRAEICSQLLFGDHVAVVQKKENWWLVKNAYDEYEGWMDFKQLAVLASSDYPELSQSNYLVPASSDNIVIDPKGSKYHLSPGSTLPFFADGRCRIADEQYHVTFSPHVVSAGNNSTLISDALFFQNTSYLWGGKNMFGIDCSGFTQIVFKLSGIKLKRDAWQQAEQGIVVDFLPEVRPGDLAFFDNSEGRITHVGIMLNNTEIIHASGKVRIDKLDNQGIFNTELGRYTHKLRIIKRLT